MDSLGDCAKFFLYHRELTSADRYERILFENLDKDLNKIDMNNPIFGEKTIRRVIDSDLCKKADMGTNANVTEGVINKYEKREGIKLWFLFSLFNPNIENSLIYLDKWMVTAVARLRDVYILYRPCYSEKFYRKYIEKIGSLKLDRTPFSNPSISEGFYEKYVFPNIPNNYVDSDVFWDSFSRYINNEEEFVLKYLDKLTDGIYINPFASSNIIRKYLDYWNKDVIPDYKIIEFKLTEEFARELLSKEEDGGRKLELLCKLYLCKSISREFLDECKILLKSLCQGLIKTDTKHSYRDIVPSVRLKMKLVSTDKLSKFVELLFSLSKFFDCSDYKEYMIYIFLQSEIDFVSHNLLFAEDIYRNLMFKAQLKIGLNEIRDKRKKNVGKKVRIIDSIIRRTVDRVWEPRRNSRTPKSEIDPVYRKIMERGYKSCPGLSANFLRKHSILCRNRDINNRFCFNNEMAKINYDKLPRIDKLELLDYIYKPGGRGYLLAKESFESNK